MKKISIIAAALLLSVVFASTALAAPPKVYVSQSNNTKTIGVSYGDHGYYRTVGANDRDLSAVLKNINKNIKWAKYGDRYVYHDSKGNVYTRLSDYDAHGKWVFYTDAKGKKHYIYLKDKGKYDWHRHTDKKGVVHHYIVLK